MIASKWEIKVAIVEKKSTAKSVWEWVFYAEILACATWVKTRAKKSDKRRNRPDEISCAVQQREHQTINGKRMYVFKFKALKERRKKSFSLYYMVASRKRCSPFHFFSYLFSALLPPLLYELNIWKLLECVNRKMVSS